MWQVIGLTVGFCFLFGATIFLARREGSKAAQLENLKLEIKKRAEEQARANRIITHNDDLPIADVRKRLQDITSK